MTALPQTVVCQVSFRRRGTPANGPGSLCAVLWLGESGPAKQNASSPWVWLGQGAGGGTGTSQSTGPQSGPSNMDGRSQ
jgi:hypothetical protein